MTAPAVQVPIYTPAPATVPDSRGIGTLGIVAIIVGATTVAGLAEVWQQHQLSWITGAVFVVSCLVAALMARRSDLWMAVIAAPLGFLAALIISGQLAVFSGGGTLMIRETELLVTGLAANAPYIFAGTALALIIVVIRRAMFRSRDRKSQLGY